MYCVGILVKKIYESYRPYGVTALCKQRNKRFALFGFTLVSAECVSQAKVEEEVCEYETIKKNRKFIVVANYKMYGGKKEIQNSFKLLKKQKLDKDVEIVIAPPSLYLEFTKRFFTKEMSLAGQNCHKSDKGNYTGELSTSMFKEFGVKWILVGQSERRYLFNESDAEVGDKTCKALYDGLNVVLCVGENKEAHDSGKTKNILEKQLQEASLHVEDWNKVVISYEPAWAINSPNKPSPDQIQTTHKEIRQLISTFDGCSERSENVRIIYGGCLNKNEIADVAKQEDVDGFMVGGCKALNEDLVYYVNAIKNLNDDIAKKNKELKKLHK